ncbi:MAG: RNA polymerase sigma factor [Planctomycetota bacterium]
MQQGNQEDILLRRAIHNKDREALGQLNILYYPRIKRYITSRVNLIEDVEDLTQSVFLEFCRNNKNYKKYQNAEAFLLKIAKDRIALHYRSQIKQVKTIPIESVDEISLSDEVRQYQNIMGQVLQQEHKIFKALVNQLSPKAQEAIRLRFEVGLDSNDAAKSLGCSVAAFHKRLQRAIGVLKRKKKRLM